MRHTLTTNELVKWNLHKEQIKTDYDFNVVEVFGQWDCMAKLNGKVEFFNTGLTKGDAYRLVLSQILATL
jgi:hypothetical protein